MFLAKKSVAIFMIFSILLSIVDVYRPALTMAEPLPGSGNLIINPGFEAPAGTNGVSANWFAQGPGIFKLTGTMVSGGNSAQQITADGMLLNQYAGVSQTLDVVSGTPYKFSGRFFVERANNAVVQLYADFIKDGSIIDSKVFEFPAQLTHQFITLGGYGVVPEGATSVTIYTLIRSVSNGGGGSFVTDNVLFEYSNDSNIISNADFEQITSSGKLEDWDYYSSNNSSLSSVSFPTISGERAHKIQASSLPVNGYAGISQRVKINPGKTFQIKGSLFIDAINNAKAQIYIDFIDIKGNYVGAKIVEYSKASQGTYLNLSDSGKVPDNALFAIVCVLIRGTAVNGAGTMYVDYIDFDYTDEPNLLINGDFEARGATWGDGWKPNYGEDNHFYQIINRKGNNVLNIEASNIKKNAYVGIHQTAKVLPNQMYTMSGRFSVDRMNQARVQLYADFYTVDGKYLEANIIEFPRITYGEYVTVSNTGTVPNSADYVILYTMVRATEDGGSGNIYIDDMSFSYINNLLLNPGFERTDLGTDDASGWIKQETKSAGSELTSVGNSTPQNNMTSSMYSTSGRLVRQSLIKDQKVYHTLFKYDLNGNLLKRTTLDSLLSGSAVWTGQKAQKVFGYWLPADSYVGVSQKVTVIPNKSFDLAANVKITVLQQAKMQIYVDFYAANGAFVGSSIKEVIETNGKYVLLNHQGVVPVQAAYATVNFLLRSTGKDAAGEFYLDSVSLNYK